MSVLGCAIYRDFERDSSQYQSVEDAIDLVRRSTGIRLSVDSALRQGMNAADVLKQAFDIMARRKGLKSNFAERPLGAAEIIN